MATTTSYTNCTACCGGVTVPCSTDAIPTTLFATFSGGTGGWAYLNGLVITMTYSATGFGGTPGGAGWEGCAATALTATGGGSCMQNIYIYCASTTQFAIGIPSPGSSVPANTCPSSPFTGGSVVTPASTSPFHIHFVRVKGGSSGFECNSSNPVNVGDQVTVDITS